MKPMDSIETMTRGRTRARALFWMLVRRMVGRSAILFSPLPDLWQLGKNEDFALLPGIV
jgi:hypothetical protein